MRRFWFLVIGAGCGFHETPLDLAAAGRPVAVVVERSADGALRAAELRVARSREDDDDEQDREVAIEDLPQAVLDAVRARHPGATLLAAEQEGAELGVELVDAEGRHLEVEFDRTGRFLEEEPADDDDDDDEIVSQAFVEEGAERGFFGITLVGAVPDGPLRVVGRYAGDDRFEVAASGSASGRCRLGGVSQGATGDEDVFELLLMDRRIRIDASTRVEVVDEPLDAE